MSNVRINTEESQNALLRVDDLNKTFYGRSRGKKTSTYAVRGVSLSVSRGETVGIVGESGCGKTTLARMIGGLEEPSRGVMTFDSRPLKFTKELHKRITIVFQDPYASLNPRMSTEVIIREPMHLLSDEELDARLEALDSNGVASRPNSWFQTLRNKFTPTRREKEARYARALVEMVQLRPEWVSRYPHEFSGGQRQRLGIARALATSPDLLILDEPVSALDVSVQAGIISLLQELKTTSDLAMLFISHDLRVVRHICDRVVVMYLGQIMEDGPAEMIFNHPCHPYTRTLLASIPTRPDEPTVRDAESTSDTELPAPDKKEFQHMELPSPKNPPTGCPFRHRCERAQEICTTQPPLAQMTDSRLVACHFPY
jgi:oligopeptide/dipeptide ABC transporter ATP-binding protein